MAATGRLGIVLVCFIIVTNLFSSVTAVEQKLLKEEELFSLGFTKYESVNPDSLTYPLKRFGEQAKLFFTFDEGSKTAYFLSLLDTRFNELVYTINFKKTGFLNETVSRYNTFVGKVKLNSKNIKADNKLNFSRNIKVLEMLRDQYPANSAYWLNIQQSIDTTRSLL